MSFILQRLLNLFLSVFCLVQVWATLGDVSYPAEDFDGLAFGLIDWVYVWCLLGGMSSLAAVNGHEGLRTATHLLWLVVCLTQSVAFVLALGASGISPAFLWLTIGLLVNVSGVRLEKRELWQHSK